MVEVRQFQHRVELVSDDSNGENIIIEEALEGLPAGERWAAAEVENGELVIKIDPGEYDSVGSALAEAEYCWDAAAALDELASEKQG